MPQPLFLRQLSLIARGASFQLVSAANDAARDVNSADAGSGRLRRLNTQGVSKEIVMTRGPEVSGVERLLRWRRLPTSVLPKLAASAAMRLAIPCLKVTWNSYYQSCYHNGTMLSQVRS